MKTLTLVRHAKSSWKDKTLSDHDRPLNKRGKRDAPRMGKRLAKASICPDLIVTSTAVRAKRTAETIAAEIGYPISHIMMDEGLYLSGVSGVLDLIHNLGDANNHVMLFGHNPGFTDLARALTGEYIVNMPTCAVYCVGFDVDSWSKVSRESGTCAFFDFPKSKP